ncbi:MAG TPA: MDR family MFS transporter [Tepidiformaceae bacterium]|nr:MDR family MFS transporter [Tepidiformaceae bacterium]
MARRGIEYKYIVAIVSVFGLFMELLDATIVNVAIPTLAREFNATTTSIEWVVTGYLLSLAVFIPVSGWAGDRFGTKRTFMFATGLFTVASLLCAAAWSIESLIVFRAMQGIGGGMLTPVGTAMVFRAFPPEERSKASGLMVIPTTVAPASGPVLGGFLIDYISWEWIFLVNVPIGVAGFVVAWRFLREHREPNPGRFDIPGFVLAATGMGTLLYALAEAGTKGWTSTEVVGFGTAGVVLIAGFVAAELRAPQPMIDVRLLKDRLFRACNAAQFVGMTGFSASLFLLPIMLQAQRGLSAFESGLTSFPMALGVMTAAQPVSRAYTRLGPRRLIAAGLVVASLTSFAFYDVDGGTNLWLVRLLMYVRGMGFGLMLVPLQAATFSTISPAMTGRASSIFSSGRMVAQSLGVAVIATVLTSRLSHHGAALGNPATRAGAFDAFQEAFVIAGIMTLVGVIAALAIRDRDAAASMRPRPVGASTPGH